MTVTLADYHITFPKKALVHNDDGYLDPLLIEGVLREMFPHAASLSCEGKEYCDAENVKIIEHLSFDSPVLHFFVREEPDLDQVGIARKDPSTGRVLTANIR